MRTARLFVSAATASWPILAVNRGRHCGLLRLPAVLLCLLVLSGFSRHYQAGMHESGWSLKKTRLQCRLEHVIPDYGRAVFSYQSLSGYQFRMQVWRRNVHRDSAQVRALPTAWKHDAGPSSIAKVPYRKGVAPFRFKRDLAVTLLARLEQGFKPVFAFTDQPGPGDEVTVALSVVNFRPAYRAFQACTANLNLKGFNTLSAKKAKTPQKIRVDKGIEYIVRNGRVAEISIPTVLFDTAKYEIKSHYKPYLDKMADYIIRTGEVTEIYIDGHTDFIGTHRYNDKLSARRANVVRDYLLARKVPARLIRTRYYGKRRPVANNRTKSGRRKNRRSVVRFIRTSQ